MVIETEVRVIYTEDWVYLKEACDALLLQRMQQIRRGVSVDAPYILYCTWRIAQLVYYCEQNFGVTTYPSARNSHIRVATVNTEFD